jgi:hypothetical protein
MICFPFLLTNMMEVPSSGSLSSPPDVGFPVIYSISPSSFCAYLSLGCFLIMSNFVCSLSPPFVLWDTLTLTGCCGFPMATGSCICGLSCESISFPTIIGAYSSSSTSVAVTGSTYGDGIASTPTIPSLCAISCAASMVSCGDLRLLQVFHVVFLGVPTFGGAMMGNYFFLD